MQEKTAVGPTDEMAIRELFEQPLDAWGRGDGQAYATQFTEDADYVAFDRSHTKGRQQIASSHQHSSTGG